MLVGSRDGFGLEFHGGRDPGLLCVDVFVGGLWVDARDNAFYPPLLVKKLKDELVRFRVPTAAPAGFTSPVEALRVAERARYDEAGLGADDGAAEELARWVFLEWGECTDDAAVFAFPDGESVHLACRTFEGGGAAWGTEPRQEPTVVSVRRAEFVETLERGVAVAEREWSVRLAALREDRGDGAPRAGA
ncbi:hypothetical protein ACFV1L_25155 [Kitasatospora sp. NPDC059646]|uniref:hypothetical protein n=1 Tax=Kitasatospora sp. NPDC059646 TaxID=3346893 RepID=UPI00369F9120